MKGYYCRARGHKWSGWQGPLNSEQVRECTRGGCHERQRLVLRTKTGTVGKDIEREVTQ